MKTYLATSLEDIARLFDSNSYAEEIAADRTNVAKHKQMHKTRANVWHTAANILRDTTLNEAAS